MDNIHFGEGELRLMEILWKSGEMPAKELVAAARKEACWEKNTAYTMIKRLIDKGAIRREEPDFVCVPLIKQNDVRRQEMHTLLNKMFDGSAKLFFKTFMTEQQLSDEELEEIRQMIDEKR